MSSFYILFVCLAFLSPAITSPLPVITGQNSATYDLQALVRPTEINALEDIEPNQAVVDVIKTIDQVQTMLDSNPNLPRLTRGEIEDLFEEVTKEEYEKSIEFGDYERARQMRALMLVLPYNTYNGSADDLQELYNRPPITKVIPSEPRPLKPQKVISQSGKVEIISVNQPIPTTYKPAFIKRKTPIFKYPTPTTYRPSIPYKKPTSEFFIPTIPTTTTTTTTTVTPIIEETKSTTGLYSSHYNANLNEFPLKQDRYQMLFDKIGLQADISSTTTTSTTTISPKITSKPKITPELEEILESLGFSGQSQSRKRFKLDDQPPPPPAPSSSPIFSMFTKENALSTKPISSLIKQNPFNVNEFKPISSSISVEDFHKSLIPDVRPNDYVAFKPIPIPDDDDEIIKIKPDLEDYLNKYGLSQLTNGRSQKSMKKSKNRNDLNLDSEISEHKNSRIDYDIEKPIKNTFNPTEIENTDEEDFKKLQELLNTIRELQELNANLTEDNLKKLDLKNFNFSETLLAHQGPDPIDEIDLEDTRHNEIKRQTDSPDPLRFTLGLSLDDEESSSSSTLDFTETSTLENNDIISTTEISTTQATTEIPTTQATATTTTTTTTIASPITTMATEESRNGAISDLEASFGGAGLDPIVEEPLPPPRRNGFYFLADWNSFLEVGEDSDKVVVRFNKTIGDPSRFLPVNVP